MVRYGIRENPYVGLRPFGLDDSLYFFGRRQQVGELLELLHRTHFLAVVGSSGCGKSSLIRAGLIPALRGGFLVEDRARWLEAIARPGDAPLMNLAEALVAMDAASPDATSPDAAERLRQDLAERHTEAALDAIVPRLGADANLLLLVDQFEELFAFRGFEEEEHLDAMNPAHRRRIRSRRAEAADFVDLLLALAARTDLPVYVVLTMRTDFLGDCDLFYGLPEAMNRSRYLVPRLGREQLRAAIEGPARLGGGSVAPRLVDTLLNELGDRADRLPILQHALQRTWQAAHRNGADGTLDLGAYRTAGTLEDALSDDAEEALQSTDLDVAARVFKRLTDTDLAGRRVRRPARFSELVAVSGADAETVRTLLDAFHGHDRSFVYFSEHDPDTGDFRVDLSHESLIRQWDRLKEWVDEERRDRAVYRELVDRARADREPLRGRDLRRAWAWRRRFRPTPAWAARYDTQDGDFDAAMDYFRRSHRRRHYRTLGLGAMGAVVVLLLAVLGYQNYQRFKRNGVEMSLQMEYDQLNAEARNRIARIDSLTGRTQALEAQLAALLPKLGSGTVEAEDLLVIQQTLDNDRAQAEPTRTTGSKALTEAELTEAARRIRVEPAVLKALIEVQSSGSGFVESCPSDPLFRAGCPRILFERSAFRRRLTDQGVDVDRLVQGNEAVLSPRPGGYLSGAAEYERLEQAMRIDRETALACASWGLLGISGWHWQSLGFRSVEDFVRTQTLSEAKQLETALRFMAENRMIEPLRAKDWDAFSRRYYGPAYAKYSYRDDLERTYNRIAKL